MKSLTKLSLAIFAAAFVFSTPVIAADATSVAPAITATKPDPAAALKGKAADVVNQAQKKVDDSATSIKKDLGVKEKMDASTQGAKSEIVDVQQETTTIQTPQGTAQETTTIITPEGQAPATPQAK